MSVANLRLRRSQERGQADHGWLQSRFTFSFADYYDPAHMGFRTLRVINEDFVAPGKGFGSHPHRDMEILTYVVKGALEHKDSMGNTSVIKPGEVQKMSAGTGIVHSEFNPSKTETTHLLQIWIVPEKKGIAPMYEQFALPTPDEDTPLQLIASYAGGPNIIRFFQDVELYRGLLKKDATCVVPVRPKRGIWVQMIDGELAVNEARLGPGDAVAVENEEVLTLQGHRDAEFLLFDLG